jgi:hypothetical protein
MASCHYGTNRSQLCGWRPNKRDDEQRGLMGINYSRISAVDIVDQPYRKRSAVTIPLQTALGSRIRNRRMNHLVSFGVERTLSICLPR